MTHPHYTAPERRIQVLALFHQLRSVPLVALKLGIARSTCYGIIERSGGIDAHRAPKLGDRLEAKLHEFFAAKATDVEIAQQLGWARKRVRYHRERLGYPIAYHGRAAEKPPERVARRLLMCEQRWGVALAGQRFVSVKAAPVGRIATTPMRDDLLRSSADF